jgi:hypothetical protein
MTQLIENGQEALVKALQKQEEFMPSMGAGQEQERAIDTKADQVLGDEMDRSVWYDGKTLSLLDKQHNVYAVNQAPDTIDAMLDYVAEELMIGHSIVL